MKITETHIGMTDTNELCKIVICQDEYFVNTYFIDYNLQLKQISQIEAVICMNMQAPYVISFIDTLNGLRMNGYAKYQHISYQNLSDASRNKSIACLLGFDAVISPYDKDAMYFTLIIKKRES